MQPVLCGDDAALACAEGHDDGRLRLQGGYDLFIDRMG